MASRALSKEEIGGLVLAALGHAALVWVLVNAKPPEPLPPPERMTVTLSEDTGAVSTSPNPQADPAADRGPELGEPAPAAEPEPQPEPKPEPVAKPQPPQPRPSVAPAPVAKAPPRPPQPAPKPPTKWPFDPPRQASKAPPRVAPAKAAATPARVTPAKSPPARPGASSFDAAFKSGIPGGSAKGKDKVAPAAQASAQQVASWSSSINAKVRGPWIGCPISGLDANKLRATVRFTLDKSGRVLTIEPFDVTGITDANRPQAKPFKDCAIRAIRLAAPFTGLPPEFYDQWKSRKLNFSKQ